MNHMLNIASRNNSKNQDKTKVNQFILHGYEKFSSNIFFEVKGVGAGRISGGNFELLTFLCRQMIYLSIHI